MYTDMKMVIGKKERKFYLDSSEKPIYAECSGCKQILPVENFNKEEKATFGIKSQCKACRKANDKKRPLSEEAKERKRLRDSKWRSENKDYSKNYYAKHGKSAWKKGCHDPVIYKICFPKFNALYIGQTINLRSRVSYHKKQSKKGEHCDLMNSLYINDFDYFVECLGNAEVIEQFANDTNKSLITEREYSEQIKYMCLGYNVLGMQNKDFVFLSYLANLVGGTDVVISKCKDVLLEKLSQDA